MIKLLVVIELALSRSGRPTPTLAAMPARKSPGRTVYLAAGEVADATASPVGMKLKVRVRVLRETATTEV